MTNTQSKIILIFVVLLSKFAFGGGQTWIPTEFDGKIHKLEDGVTIEGAFGYKVKNVINGQFFINQKNGMQLGVISLRKKEYTAQSKCAFLLIYRKQTSIRIPDDPDIDLPLSCTEKVGVSFVHQPQGDFILSLLEYSSPSGALTYYPVVFDVTENEILINKNYTVLIGNKIDNQDVRSVAKLKEIFLKKILK